MYGLSSGLFYVPGSFAKTEEVIELTKVAAEFGGLYTSHIRDEGNYDIGVRASVLEVIRIAEEARTIGIVTHMKALGTDSWGLSGDLLKMIEDARAARRSGIRGSVSVRGVIDLVARRAGARWRPGNGRDRGREPAAAKRSERDPDRVLPA